MLHFWPNDPADDGNDPADDGNALAGVWHAVLIEVGVGLGLFVVWVAAALLLYWLF